MAYGDRYRLRADAPEFEIMEGLLCGIKYKQGQEYEFVPAAYRDRFERTYTADDDPMIPVDIIPRYKEARQ